MTKVQKTRVLRVLGRAGLDSGLATFLTIEADKDEVREVIELIRKMKENTFTGDFQKSMACAQEEVVRLKHEYVGTEHLLLGMIKTKESLGAAVLSALGFDLDLIAAEVEDTIPKGNSRTRTKNLHLTSRVKKVLKFAQKETQLLKHRRWNSAHILLGIIHEEKGIAIQILFSLDQKLTLERARQKTCEITRTVYPTEKEIKAHFAQG